MNLSNSSNEEPDEKVQVVTYNFEPCISVDGSDSHN